MKRLLLLFVVLVVLGSIAWWLQARRPSGTLAGALTDFAIEDTASVDRIFIAEKDGRTVDLRREADGWTANGVFRANPDPINLLLKTFLRVELRAPVPKSAEPNVLRLMASTARKVEIYTGGDAPGKIWYVGHSTKDHVGTYMVLEIPGQGRSNVPFIMGMSGFTGFLTTRFHANLDDWRSTNVFVYPEIRTIAKIRSEHADPSDSFVLSSVEGQLEMTDAAGRELAMDTLLVQDIVLQFRDLHYEYIERNLTPVQRDSVMQIPPKVVLTVTTTDGDVLRVPFRDKGPYHGQRDAEGNRMDEVDVDRMYAVLEDTVLVTVQRHLFDRILVPSRVLTRMP
ncbi:MAG: hypothetical protein KDB88_08925 [Flavobacteriales bacterium]|nr:hypothetical protein [Flavobacteriales bacterium]